jgi:hypothetical protein
MKEIGLEYQQDHRFQGRSFIRSGIINSSDETYHKNYIFSDISSGFNGDYQKHLH